MSKRRSLRTTPFFLFLLVTVGLRAQDAAATDFDWIQPTCGMFGCGWSTPSNWSPSGPPAAGDTATIELDVSVLLTQNTGVLDGLTLRNGAAVFTAGRSLNVSGSGSTTFVWGTGPRTSGNTAIFVNSGAGLGLDFVVRFLSLHTNAELRMLGGGAVASFGIIVSQSSLISGFGTVVLLNDHTSLAMSGTVRPENGDLSIVSLEPDRIDLDGSVGEIEPGRVDVTADGNLSIEGSLADSFSGVLDIGNSNSVEFDSALDMDGELNFTSGPGNQLIAPSISFDTGAQVTVDQAIGHIDAISTWSGGATIHLIDLADELHLLGDSTFDFSTVFSGSGLLVNDSGATMTLLDTANVGTALANHGTLAVGALAGSAVLEQYLQTGVGALEIEIGGLSPGVDFDQIGITNDAGLDGTLDVSMLNGFMLTAGDSFEIIDIGGVATGTFTGLGEGSLVDTFNGEDLFITYAGGDGNDVVLYAPEPGRLSSLALGLVALLCLRGSGIDRVRRPRRESDR